MTSKMSKSTTIDGVRIADGGSQYLSAIAKKWRIDSGIRRTVWITVGPTGSGISAHYSEVIMNDVIKVGDTICCHDYADMNDVLTELRRQGYLCTVQVGYTIRIESVPLQNPTEQDGWVTWNK